MVMCVCVRIGRSKIDRLKQINLKKIVSLAAYPTQLFALFKLYVILGEPRFQPFSSF